MNPLLKVVLLGDMSVGKTALLSQFVNRQFKEKYKATIGSDFLTKEMMIGNQLVTLQLWDTAGQERFNSLGAAFFRGADICILVFDLTRSDTFNRLNFWKNEFVHQANIENPETFPFVYIGNKSDLESTRQVTYQMGFEFCDRERGIAYYETSAKTSENVEKAFSTAATTVLNQVQTQPKPAITEKNHVDIQSMPSNVTHKDDGCCS